MNRFTDKSDLSYVYTWRQETYPVAFSIDRKKPPFLRFILNPGVERIELPSAVLETDVLPLYDTPK